MSALDYKSLNSEFWRNSNTELPSWDISRMREKTLAEPGWIHFGAGNIFRFFIAGLQDTLLSRQHEERGIIVAETFDREIIDRIYKPYDCLTLAVTMGSDGSFRQRVVASVADACCCNGEAKEGYERLASFARQKQLQMMTFTITEKGYKLTDSAGDYLPDIVSAFQKGPGCSDHIMVNVASLLYRRFQAGKLPIALVSLDNCAANGRLLHQSVSHIARRWSEEGLVEEGFLRYLNDSAKVSFPWSMIDKITPRPSQAVQEMLERQGIERMEPICTGKNTYIAPFVNAEEAQYLVIEDDFPNGRPPLEEAGVLFTDRDTVSKVEAMKVTACLNPLHTALAVFGCLLGYTSIAEEMRDRQLQALVHRIGYGEALPVVTDPGILNPEQFIHEVLEVRFPNRNIPDTPQRIATDTSQKIPIRFGKTIAKYVRAGRNLSELTGISLTIAGWLRYLLAVDDAGRAFSLSPDPMLPDLQPIVKEAAAGTVSQLDRILCREDIFGVDLVQIGMNERIKTMFEEMKAGGGVRSALRYYIGEMK